MAEIVQEEAGAVRIESTIPLLRVEDLQVTIDYYVRALGFALDWEVTRMASVSRDGHPVMLCERAQGNPGTWVWVGVSDSAALYQEIRSKGAIIRMTPRNFPWAYEMLVEDPDGHVLRFGSGPLEGEPFDEWPEA
jgi:uncharacterized glyoxalase superfamily protein PhnB